MWHVLLRFEVSNYRSIFEPAELFVIAVDEDRNAVRKFESISQVVLTTAEIMGLMHLESQTLSTRSIGYSTRCGFR